MKNRSELVRLASKKSGFTKGDMAIALDAFLEVSKEILKSGEDINIMGYFRVISEVIPERELYDLNNGVMRTVPAHRHARVKFSDSFKDAIR